MRWQCCLCTWRAVLIIITANFRGPDSFLCGPCFTHHDIRLVAYTGEIQECNRILYVTDFYKWWMAALTQLWLFVLSSSPVTVKCLQTFSKGEGQAVWPTSGERCPCLLIKFICLWLQLYWFYINMITSYVEIRKTDFDLKKCA